MDIISIFRSKVLFNLKFQIPIKIKLNNIINNIFNSKKIGMLKINQIKMINMINKNLEII